MEDMFWVKLRSLSDEELEKTIEMANEQLNTNRYNRKRKALRNLFAALNELAETGGEYIHLYEGEDSDGVGFSINVRDIAHFMIDEYGF